MQRLSTKLIILLILAALVPLGLYGLLSIWTSRKAQYQAVSQGNQRVAVRAAEQTQLYVNNSLSILKAIAENINRVGLERWQQEAIIKNYVINFPEFQEVYITDRRGQVVLTTRLTGEPANISQEAGFQPAISGSEVVVSPDFIPVMTIAVPLRRLNQIDGIVAARLNLMHMWNLVDSIRIGQQGYALVVSGSGTLIAHGQNAAKPRILQQENLEGLAIVRAGLAGQDGSSFTTVYRTTRTTGSARHCSTRRDLPFSRVPRTTSSKRLKSMRSRVRFPTSSFRAGRLCVATWSISTMAEAIRSSGSRRPPSRTC